MKPIPILLLWCSLIISSCTPTPQPIDYGSDGCDFCKMNIVDAKHAAELVTSKGKVYKFDAIECLIQYQEKNKEVSFAFQLVNCYDEPKLLNDAKTCLFLISENLPSPMGAYLTAFSNKEEVVKMQSQKGGKIYDWPGILNQYQMNNMTLN